MIDQLVGRPSPSWKRAQVFLVIFFWLWRIIRGDPNGPSLLFVRRANRYLAKRYTPWQLIVTTLTGLYAARNFDKIIGLPAPEPLAGVYSPAFYRATWISTGLDAGFATAMSIRPKWLRDICSLIFSAYYIIYANEADEKLRKFRGVPNVEVLRSTWEKTSNPFIRLALHLPRIATRRRILLPRPSSSEYQRPITAYLFFCGNDVDLAQSTDLILDYPGGGFISMNATHHEERLRSWALRTRRPVLAIDYGKAPEYPYPFGIDESFDTYRVIVDSKGLVLGMSGRKLNVIMTGDSAGATMAVNVIFKVLEYNLAAQSTNRPESIPLPVATVFNYPFLDFNFTSWMSTSQIDHLQHISPKSMVGDKGPGYSRGKRLKRKKSWRDTLRGFTSGTDKDESDKLSPIKTRHSTSAISRIEPRSTRDRSATLPSKIEDQGELADGESEDDESGQEGSIISPAHTRVRFASPTSEENMVRPIIPWTNSQLYKRQNELSAAVADADNKAVLAVGASKGKEKEQIETRLTMTSRTAYFQDRIITPSMMRAMAILYIGPNRNPDFSKDYHLSPILAPSHLLAQFPPLLLQCGEKDPFVDDTIIFAGRIKEAKRARIAELEAAIANGASRVTEGLRMSTPEGELSAGEARLVRMKRERNRLVKETEDDWAKMVLFSEWSHGYLQMPSLMSEALSVIEELADWIGDAFDRYSPEKRNAEVDANKSDIERSPLMSETDTDDALTFVTKKGQLRQRRFSPPQNNESQRPRPRRKSPPSHGSEDTLLEIDPHTSAVTDEDGVAVSNGRSVTPPKVAGRQTGQTITEMELMRRRRMIDSHIYE